MASSLRELPFAGRQLLNAASRRIPTASSSLSARRYASSQPSSGVDESASIPDIEHDSGLATSSIQRADIKLTDPRRRASRRSHELPHERYRYHPPKYYRGPLHPVQPPPSSDPVARDFEPGPFNYPRLRQTFDSTIAVDLMTLGYLHKPPGTVPREERIRLREWDDSTPYMSNRPKRGPRGSDNLFPLEKNLTFRNIPEIHAVHVNMYVPEARKNPDHIVVARSVLQNIMGVRPTVTKSRSSVAQWGVVKGERTGVKASIYGNSAWEFVDKVVQLVLPKIKEWPGVAGTSGDSSGNIGFGLDPAHVAYFPEVEANYSLYPSKMIPGCRIVIETTATSDRHARLLCKALGIPFYGKLVD